MTEEGVRALYPLLCKPDAYFGRYEHAGDVEKELGLDASGWDAPRAFCVADFKRWVGERGIRPRHTLCTWREDPELVFLPSEATTEIRYDGVANDLHALDLPEKDYDFVLFSQTLEHLSNPGLALRNLRKHMCEGGHIFTSVPFVNIPHSVPFHFQHFTPMGLATLFVLNGFEVLEVGFWGNMEYIHRLFYDRKWPGIHELSSVKNEVDRSVQCWILARKPEK